MELLSIFALFCFFVLIIASVFMIMNFYVCDSHTCKAYKTANAKEEGETKENKIALLQQLFNDGIWAVPFIASAIATPLSMWLARIEFNVRTFAIFFLVFFAIFYFTLSFMGHHYVKVIANDVVEFMSRNEMKEKVVA